MLEMDEDMWQLKLLQCLEIDEINLGNGQDINLPLDLVGGPEDILLPL